jgi:hypothetical protein
MAKPRTVAGLYKKNTSACWKVMKTKETLNTKEVHKHDRPWSTPHSRTRNNGGSSKAVTDEQGTMLLETFLKIKDQIAKQDVGNPKSKYVVYI